MREIEQQTDVISLNASGTALVASAPALPSGDEIYDLMPPHALSYPWGELLLQVAAVIIVFYLLWMFYSWLTAPVVRPRRAVIQSPRKLAQRAIERLRLSPVWQERQQKEICETLAGILKTYAREGFDLGIGAPATSDEFMQSLISGKVALAVRSEAKELMRVCDLIKFSGDTAVEKSQEELLDMLSALVNREDWRQ